MPKLKHREKMPGTTIQFTPAQMKALALLARAQDRAIAYIVRLAVDEYINRQPTPIKPEREAA